MHIGPPFRYNFDVETVVFQLNTRRNGSAANGCRSVGRPAWVRRDLTESAGKGKRTLLAFDWRKIWTVKMAPERELEAHGGYLSNEDIRKAEARPRPMLTKRRGNRRGWGWAHGKRPRVARLGLEGPGLARLSSD